MQQTYEQRLISICLPFKNEESFIEACIESIVNQSYTHWELLAVDDHSTDNSPNMVKNYSLQDARIKYVKNEGTGVIEALNTAFRHSSGGLITRMDGDDIKTLDNLEAMVELVAPGVLAIGQVRYFREDGLGDGYARYTEWLNQLTAAHRNFDEVYKECVVPSPCWLATRADFIASGGFDSKFYPEDYDLCLRFYKQGLKTRGTAHVIHDWRDYDTRTTRVSPHYSDNRFLHLKIHYFIETDYDNGKELVLIGAGKKGKRIAQDLNAHGLSYRWLTSNTNKIGHNIYEVVLEDLKSFKWTTNQQVIVGLSDVRGQQKVRGILPDTAQAFWFF